MTAEFDLPAPLEPGAPPVERLVVGQVGRLAYLDWGRTSERPVVFLHGIGLNAHHWDGVCALLRDERWCVALDLRGHGDSAWPAGGDYSLAAFVQDLATHLRDLGAPDAVLVGHSLGGRVALSYATEHPVSSLVMVDVGPDARPGGAERVRAFMATSTELAAFEDFVDAAAAFRPARSREQLRRALRLNLRQTPDGGWAWKYDARVLQPSVREEHAARGAELWSALPRIGVPTLVLRGENSDVFLEDDAQRVARALPRGEHITIAGAGHNVASDEPVAVAEAIRAFLLRSREDDRVRAAPR